MSHWYWFKIVVYRLADRTKGIGFAVSPLSRGRCRSSRSICFHYFLRGCGERVCFPPRVLRATDSPHRAPERSPDFRRWNSPSSISGALSRSLDIVIIGITQLCRGTRTCGEKNLTLVSEACDRRLTRGLRQISIFSSCSKLADTR